MKKHEDYRLKVLLTGFEAFEANDFTIDKNTSGEAVKVIEKRKYTTEESYNIDLTTAVIPVQYQHIDEQIPCLWEQVQPDLSIHVGVSDIATGLVLEGLAEKAQYVEEDDHNYCPVTKQNPCTGPDILATDLDIEDICSKYNEDLPKGCATAEVSYNAGKYICEYIYYTSMALYEQNGRRKCSLFVHVPLKTEDEEIGEISKELERLIKICVDHIRTTQLY